MIDKGMGANATSRPRRGHRAKHMPLAVLSIAGIEQFIGQRDTGATEHIFRPDRLFFA